MFVREHSFHHAFTLFLDLFPATMSLTTKNTLMETFPSHIVLTCMVSCCFFQRLPENGFYGSRDRTKICRSEAQRIRVSSTCATYRINSDTQSQSPSNIYEVRWDTQFSVGLQLRLMPRFHDSTGASKKYDWLN